MRHSNGNLPKSFFVTQYVNLKKKSGNAAYFEDLLF
jgi:hypothetical protein